MGTLHWVGTLQHIYTYIHICLVLCRQLLQFNVAHELDATRHNSHTSMQLTELVSHIGAYPHPQTSLLSPAYFGAILLPPEMQS